ncbi:MAG: PQQ-binding-like beta-propeller repeat protein [Chloroflexi bacterium SZAS-1]|nr:PQQ-binding-like beta-propeller repeat protein [Chloroflexi bacterium SZAS-1]
MNVEQDPPTLSHIERYELVAEIGRGGMGRVFRAYDEALERTVALKILAPDLAHDPRFVAALRREAISAARLRHPHIALLYEFGQTDDLAFLVMEYVPGDSLRQLLAEGPLPPHRTLAILAQIADALEYAHSVGVVHRDVKPSNILVSAGDQAVLIDFGLAELTEDLTVTGDSAQLGTPHYMSPEQAAGEPASGWSDQYALAAVAYEMFAGTPPFPGRTAAAVVHAHIYEQAPAVTEQRPALPAALNAVLQRGLAKQPAARYPAPTAFVAALQSAFDAPNRQRARPWYWLLAGFAAIVALSTLALVLWNMRAPAPSAIATVIPESVPVLQSIKWNYDLGMVGTSQPVIAARTLVFEPLNGSLVALNAENGSLRWAKDGGRNPFGAPGAGAGVVFVGDAAGDVTCLDPLNGTVLWRTHLSSGVRQAPTRSNDRVFVTTVKGWIASLHTGSGQILWSRQLADGIGIPTMGAGSVFVAGGQSLYALDLNTGDLLWVFEARSPIITQPTIFNGLVLVGTDSGALHGIEASSGAERLLWQARGAISARPLVADGALYVADQSGMLSALRPDGLQLQLIWSYETDPATAIVATPLLAGGRLIVGTSGGVVYSLDARSGGERAALQLKGSIATSPTLGTGTVFVQANRIYALGP